MFRRCKSESPDLHNEYGKGRVNLVLSPTAKQWRHSAYATETRRVLPSECLVHRHPTKRDH